MQHKHMLRVAAATTVTAFVSVGALAPVHAAGERGADKPSTSRGKRPDAAPASKAQGPKSAPGSKAQGPKSAPGSKAQGPKSAPGSKAQGPKSTPAPKPAPDHANGNASDKSANGNGHTPVTVCHRTGKAGYIVITFDENALEAHLAHGDLYPVPEGGCPTAEDTTGGSTDGGSTDGDTTGGSDAGATPGTPPVETPGDNPVEAPADADVAGGTTTQDEVLGVELTVSAGTAATAPAAPAAATAAVAPAAGVLPDTGAGEYLGATLAGLGLLGAGGVLMARRRAQQLG